jgi:ribosomal protein L7/L12
MALKSLTCPQCGAVVRADGTATVCQYCQAVLVPSAADAGLTSGDVLANEIRELLRAGKKIEAIRIYRKHKKCGLQQAKDAVEALERKA